MLVPPFDTWLSITIPLVPPRALGDVKQLDVGAPVQVGVESEAVIVELSRNPSVDPTPNNKRSEIAGACESARGRPGTGCRCAGAGGCSERSCDRRALQESIGRSHAKEQPVRRAVVKLGQGRTLVPLRGVYQKGGLTRAGDNVTGKREEIHLWIRWYASVIHESARDHVSRGRPIHPERVIKCSRVYVFPRAVSGPGR